MPENCVRITISSKYKGKTNMKIYLSIDDTDNLDSPGSGQLAEVLANELHDLGLVSTYSSITRHQLFVHEDIPYTSHNSSMCFSAATDGNNLPEIIGFAKKFLKTSSAPGSDPGLCVATNEKSLDRESLIAFGLKAKKTVLTKDEAYSLAQKTGLHLSEHGGTGDGIVGALAGVGLRLHGNDGRIRGWLKLGKSGDINSATSLCSHPLVDDVVDEKGVVLPEYAQVILTEEKLKTVLVNHRQVIPVVRSHTSSSPIWTTLSKSEVKCF